MRIHSMCAHTHAPAHTNTQMHKYTCSSICLRSWGKTEEPITEEIKLIEQMGCRVLDTRSYSTRKDFSGRTHETRVSSLAHPTGLYIPWLVSYPLWLYHCCTRWKDNQVKDVESFVLPCNFPVSLNWALIAFTHFKCCVDILKILKILL